MPKKKSNLSMYTRNCTRLRRIRSQLTPEEREAIKSAAREKAARAYSQETPEKREVRLCKMRIRQRMRRKQSKYLIENHQKSKVKLENGNIKGITGQAEIDEAIAVEDENSYCPKLLDTEYEAFIIKNIDSCNTMVVDNHNNDNHIQSNLKIGNRILSDGENTNKDFVVFKEEGISNENMISDKIRNNDANYNMKVAKADPLELIKCENVTFECTICSIEFIYEEAYNEHYMKRHAQVSGKITTNFYTEGAVYLYHHKSQYPVDKILISNTNVL